MKRIKDRVVKFEVQCGTFLFHLEVIGGRRGYTKIRGERFPTFRDFRLNLRRETERETTPVLGLIAFWHKDFGGYAFEEEGHDLLCHEIYRLAPPFQNTAIYLAVLEELENLLTINYPPKRKLR